MLPTTTKLFKNIQKVLSCGKKLIMVELCGFVGGIKSQQYSFKQNNVMKIKHARITVKPKGWFDPLPKVFATFEDGEEEFLFDYYPDEICFFPEEFVGLTRKEAKDLKRKKDLEYLNELKP
jgi:hypothetical protein